MFILWCNLINFIRMYCNLINFIRMKFFLFIKSVNFCRDSFFSLKMQVKYMRGQILGLCYMAAEEPILHALQSCGRSSLDRS